MSDNERHTMSNGLYGAKSKTGCAFCDTGRVGLHGHVGTDYQQLAAQFADQERRRFALDSTPEFAESNIEMFKADGR